MMKLSSICSIGAVGAVSLITLGITSPANGATFVGEFATTGDGAPGNGFFGTDSTGNFLNAIDTQDAVSLGTITIATRNIADSSATFTFLTTPIASAFYAISFDWASDTRDTLFYQIGTQTYNLPVGASGTVSSLLLPTNTAFGFGVLNSTTGTLSSSSHDISQFSAVGVPWETDALPVLGSTILFGAGVWAKQKFKKVKFQK